MRLINWVLVLIAAIVTMTIAVDNRSNVVVSLWPLDWELELPLFIVLFAGIFVGLVLGLLSEFWRGRRWRREAKTQRREIDALRQENAQLKAAAGSHPASAD